MLVILRENVENLGSTGEVVKVSDGYARNFLLPRNLVVAADEKSVATIEHHKKQLEKRRQAQRAVAQDLAKKLEAFSCTIARRVGEGDKLFGSVSTSDIADVLKKAGHQVDKRSIQMDTPIKALGVHTVTVKLEPEVNALLKIWVVKEE
jgi:large subunit ribosomal protein L9